MLSKDDKILSFTVIYLRATTDSHNKLEIYDIYDIGCIKKKHVYDYIYMILNGFRVHYLLPVQINLAGDSCWN